MLLIALQRFSFDLHMAVWWLGTGVMWQVAEEMKLVGITLQPA